MSSAAIVARTTPIGLEYLARSGGKYDWATTEGDADTFQNVREATRAALHLPAAFRAFALPVAAHGS
jgi:hypothetical protein